LLEVNVVVRRALGLHRIEVSGEVDQLGAVELSRALDDAVVESAARIEVGLSGATLSCCFAVTALIDARNDTGGRLVLAGAAVRRVLGVLGLASAFEQPGRASPWGFSPLYRAWCGAAPPLHNAPRSAGPGVIEQ
jgi:hypothetical protein